jgi:hypothetical protein
MVVLPALDVPFSRMIRSAMPSYELELASSRHPARTRQGGRVPKSLRGEPLSFRP